VPQAELTPARLWRELSGLLADPAALGGMRRAALARARPDAAKEIAADIEALLPPPERRP
jgi:UDP-N-acetylglucosamine:LPS N-acetylglucosamine transferase